MSTVEDQAARLAVIRERHGTAEHQAVFQVSPCDAAYLLALVDRLTQERDAYRRAAAWLLEEGGWRATYYEMSGPCPSVIDRRDSINPRLKPPAELTEADLAAPHAERTA